MHLSNITFTFEESCATAIEWLWSVWQQDGLHPRALGLLVSVLQEEQERTGSRKAFKLHARLCFQASRGLMLSTAVSTNLLMQVRTQARLPGDPPSFQFLSHLQRLCLYLIPLDCGSCDFCC